MIRKRFFRISLLVIVVTIVGLPALEFQAVGDSNPDSLPDRDQGIKYLRNYSREDYNLQPQNWSIIQDKRGVIYAGNQGGLLEFDGVSWREIQVPYKTVRSLAAADNGTNGTIYVGGMNEMAYLTPDSRGALRYVSLVPHLDEKYKNFSYVWRTYRTPEGIYFCTTKFLFLWNYEKIKVWEAKASFATPLLCGDKMYFRQHGLGLFEMNNGALELIPGGNIFASQKVYIMVEIEPGKLLVGTGSDGFYLYHGGKVTPFETAALDLVKDKVPSYGIRLSSGDFALATLRGGVFIVDSHGKLKHAFDKSTGLPDNTVWYIFEDFQGNLWLALNNGITKIEYNSPISIYNDKNSSLSGQALSIVRHGPNNNLYAGTTNGLYYLDTPRKFKHVPGIPGGCWDLLSIGNVLLAAETDGVFQVENNSIRHITKEHSYCLLQSSLDPNRIWVGKAHGLTSLYFKNQDGPPDVEREFENIDFEIRTIVEDSKGNLWLGTLANGVIKIESPALGTMMKTALDVTRFHTSHGLPDGQVRVFMAAEHLMFATRKGIFRFDEKNQVFIPDTTFGDEFAGGEKGKSIFLVKEDHKKNAWIHSHASNIQAIAQPNGIFVLNRKPFLRIPLAHVDTIYPDPNGDAIWFASVDGLIRYDTKVKKNYDLPFHTLIREAVVNGMPLFYNAEKFKYKESKGDYWKDNFPVFPFKDRNLRLQFAAPFFEAETQTQYQCYLEGYDDDWTTWSQETWKDYTNLDPGLHRFRVRAKNVYGNVSSEALFQFKVLPPWYRTWWAFVLYAISAAFMVFLVIKWRSRRLEQEKQKLEQIIKERTSEINDQKQQLQVQAEKLKEMDRVKSRFFANISHEFRTPLTLIMGPLEQMLSDGSEKKQESKLKSMLRNSQRLLGLINQLLELSKFDSGKVKLQAGRLNIIPFLKGIAASFDPLILQKDLDLAFHAEEEDITLYFDPGKLEEVLFNLLSNAVKFTPAGGKIIIAAQRRDRQWLEISVKDTGPGIPREELSHIFDRFYQADATYEHHHKGSGIGLAIAKELVELHHGSIDVHSREGEDSGTEFIVRLPMDDAHLEPDELVEISEPPSLRKIPGEISLLDEKEKQEEDMEIHEYIPGRDIILVVEDSADVRGYIRGALEPSYNVVEAADGREGIEKAQEIIPDLIISDIMMPEIDGYELCRVLKRDRNTSHIPIILLTAKAAEENIIQGLETGADDYVTKPFNTKILCARIKNLIDLRRHLQKTVDREMTLQPTKMAVSPVDKEFIKDLKEVIESNISDPDFNVNELGKRLYMSRTSVYRKILALSGEPPTEFIRSYRLKRGAELLKKGMGSVLEVAFEVGFSSANYFSKCFKKKFHLLPTAFKEIE